MMKLLDGTYLIWLIFMTISYCDLRHQNYTQDKAMEKINDAISRLNEKIEIIYSIKEHSFREEDSEEKEEEKMKTEGDNSQKEKLMHLRSSNDRSVPSFPFDEFHSRQDKEKSDKMHQRRSDRTTMTTSRGNKIEKNKFLEQGYTFRKLSLQTNSSDKHESIMSLNDKIEAENYSRTKCSLIEENKLNFYKPVDDETMFKLSLDLMTDALSHETSFALFSSHNRNESIIDSMVENSTTSNSLLPNSLHKFEYECYITVVENTNQSKTFESNKGICYDFDMYDSSNNDPGFCCYFGFGYFKVNINKEEAISDSLHGRVLTTSFCVDSNGELIKKEKENTKSSIYPSRDCINGQCLCDSNPALMNFEEKDNDEMYQIKMNVMVKMMTLSGSEKLMDVSTPQYKAACWTLNDDSFSVQQLESTSASSRRIEQRMIQRYILALFYFATNGQNWFNQYNFLSSRSECQWNTVDEFHNNISEFIGGSVCDENERVMHIGFGWNNLNGIMVDELYGLKSLEQLVLWVEKDLHGTIPSSFGRLSELRSVVIVDTSVKGSLPSQLFFTKMERIAIIGNILSSILSGTIPESIGNLQHLSHLNLALNSLSGSLPQNIYHLKNLVRLDISANKLTGTISSSIQNLGKLKFLSLGRNKFSGTIPSSMKHLRQLKELYIDNNDFSGTIPNFLSSFPNLDLLFTHNNSFTGSMTDEFCDMNMDTGVTADCKNDIFIPKVSCSCCLYCVDETPTSYGEECPDTKISVHIDHKVRSELFRERNSDRLIWELKDHSSEESILREGPFEFRLDNGLSYEACVANSQCFSLVMLAAPVEDTNYTIYWNEEPVYNGTFAGRTLNEDFNVSDSAQTMTSFQFDEKKEMVKFDNSATCRNLQLVCDQKNIDLEFNTTHRILYDAMVKISGQTMLQDPSSPQSRAFCWIHSTEIQNTTVQPSVYEFIQRYVLTLLHLTSKNGFFETDEYPPSTHECEWEGIECDLRIVTGITIPSLNHQIINGTLIHEIGSLAYLEKLELKHTELSGTIPHSFSNLWSLKKLDLSQNSISGTIPETLFRQLDNFEHIDLSENLLRGNIPHDMGSYSPLRTVLLNNNKLQGSLPFKDFKYNDLESFDVHQNLFDGIELSHLSKHTKLKKLDLSLNFFVGTLNDDILETFTELEKFNISQNEFSGVLPSEFPLFSKITHFDAHSNQIKGTIHDSIAKLSHLEYLNVQGNQLTGTIPNEMNQLEQLSTLVLSHNELKGSIPLDSSNFPSMKMLFLHANELSGEAPRFLNMTHYISDCGVPFDEAVDPVQCDTCNVCCNSENLCHTQITSLIMKPMVVIWGIILSLIGFMIIIYIMKDRVTEYFIEFFEERVALWAASKLLGEKTVYHFFLIPSGKGWLIALGCSIIQIATLALFDLRANTTNKLTDLIYSMSCSENSLDCENSVSRSSFGYLIFSVLLVSWLLRDIVGASKLFLLSLWQKNVDFFFASSVIIAVTLFSALTSIYYNLAIATKDTEIITNAVILLFVNEIDERLYQLTEACDINFIKKVDRLLERNSYHDRKELIIYRSLNKTLKRIRSILSIEKKDRAADDVEGVLEVSENENEIDAPTKEVDGN